MAQPVKKSGAYQKPRSKTVKKKTAKAVDKRLPPKNNVKKTRHKSNLLYGTSKLEEKFAKEFLDKLGVEYVYQYEAKSIKRFYDFRIMPGGPLIEINGSYWHGDSRIYEQEDLNAVQKKNMRVDKYKQEWAMMNGIPLYYIWEKDINENPTKVMEFLKKILYKADKKRKKHLYERKDDNENLLPGD